MSFKHRHYGCVRANYGGEFLNKQVVATLPLDIKVVESRFIQNLCENCKKSFLLNAQAIT